MRLHHIGLRCRDAGEADRFFVDLLGLEKLAPKELPEELASALFGIEAPLGMVHYAGPSLLVEAFFGAPAENPDPIAHACLEVDDAESFAEKARELGFCVLRVSKGAGYVTFVADGDGHKFEIKSAVR